MPSLRVQLDITPDQFLDWYRGRAQVVLAKTDDGRTVQFPASSLQRLLQPEGIHGRFLLEFDEHHKLIRISPATE